MSQEARRNVTALLIAAFVVLLFAAFALRPAAVLPVTDQAVADSLSSATDALHADCLHATDGFRCVVRIARDSNPAAQHRVLIDVDWDGCWRATEDSAARHPLTQSGCVHLWNY